jgi:hypothetical protein
MFHLLLQSAMAEFDQYWVIYTFSTPTTTLKALGTDTLEFNN